MKLFAFSILICALLCCKRQPHSTRVVHNPSQVYDSITLVNDLSNNETAFFYDLNTYETDIFPIAFRGKTPSTHNIYSNKPIFLLSIDRKVTYMINPGEKVHVRSYNMDEPELTIDGNVQRNNEMSFFNHLNSKFPEPLFFSSKPNSLTDIKTKVNALQIWNTNSNSYLNDYSKVSPVSRTFIFFAKKYLYYRELADLLSEINRSADAKHNLSVAGINSFSECDSCLIIPQYRIAAYYYNMVTSPQESFTDRYDNAKKIFTGNTKKYLLYTLLNSSLDKSINQPSYEQRVKYFLATYPQDSLTKMLQKNHDLKKEVAQSGSGGKIENEKVFNAEGRLVKWEDVMSGSKEKVIIIDFWANYCGPCIHEIPYAQELEASYDKKDITFIYVSFDSGREQWTSGMNELHFKEKANSYQLGKWSNSNIIRQFGINTIPRYIIFNKNGELVTANAPRPSDPALKTMLDKLVKN